MTVVAIADLGGRRGLGVAVAMMVVADLRRRRLGRVAVAVVGVARLGRLVLGLRTVVVVMMVMRARLGRAAREGERRCDEAGGQAASGTDHAFSLKSASGGPPLSILGWGPDSLPSSQ
jgi:hypothetical protein